MSPTFGMSGQIPEFGEKRQNFLRQCHVIDHGRGFADYCLWEASRYGHDELFEFVKRRLLSGTTCITIMKSIIKGTRSRLCA